MTVITTKLVVQPDGTVSIADPLPVGERTATLATQSGVAWPTEPLRVGDRPVHDLQPIGPWPTFSRDGMYGDDGP